MATGFVWLVLATVVGLGQCIFTGVAPAITAALEWTAVLTGQEMAESPVGGPLSTAVIGILALLDLLTVTAFDSPGSYWRKGRLVPMEMNSVVLLTYIFFGSAALGGADYTTAGTLFFAFTIRAIRTQLRLTKYLLKSPQ